MTAGTTQPGISSSQSPNLIKFERDEMHHIEEQPVLLSSAVSEEITPSQQIHESQLLAVAAQQSSMSLATHATDRTMIGSPPQVTQSMSMIPSVLQMNVAQHNAPVAILDSEAEEEEEDIQAYISGDENEQSDSSGLSNIEIHVEQNLQEEEEEALSDGHVTDPCSSVESIPKKHHHKCTPPEPWWALPQFGFKPGDVFTIKIINTVSYNYTKLRVPKSYTVQQVLEEYRPHEPQLDEYIAKDMYGNLLDPAKTLVENEVVASNEMIEFEGIRREPCIILHFKDGFEDEMEGSPRRFGTALCRNY